MSDFRARHFADPEGYPQTQVLEDFRTQPVIAALLDNPELEDLVGEDPVARFADDFNEYLDALPADAYVVRVLYHG
ncbi:hypothetical protein [Streptomyces olivochromogenes]|nr:hypothetical protein [Streptomyces olivochromogenes]KUN43707.1 hypothetical protein AQJ27_29900 [Streptomyces olivochromogenes]